MSLSECLVLSSSWFLQFLQSKELLYQYQANKYTKNNLVIFNKNNIK